MSKFFYKASRKPIFDIFDRQASLTVVKKDCERPFWTELLEETLPRGLFQQKSFRKLFKRPFQKGFN